jgi:hypothetical protein
MHIITEKKLKFYSLLYPQHLVQSQPKILVERIHEFDPNKNLWETHNKTDIITLTLNYLLTVPQLSGKVRIQTQGFKLLAQISFQAKNLLHFNMILSGHTQE